MISLQCWDQESERGAVISAVLATTTILYINSIRLGTYLSFTYVMVQFHEKCFFWDLDGPFLFLLLHYIQLPSDIFSIVPF